MSCFRKKLISVEFREAPQPMTDNIIRRHVWSVCSRLRETWFGIAALSPQHRGCESEMFWTCPVLPGESFCCGWWEHITTYLKGVILVWKWTFKGYIHNNSHHVLLKKSWRFQCPHTVWGDCMGCTLLWTWSFLWGHPAPNPGFKTQGRIIQRKYREFKP